MRCHRNACDLNRADFNLSAFVEATLAETQEANRRLQDILHAAQREKFGKRSEKLSPEQFNLPLEDAEFAQGVLEAAQEDGANASERHFEKFFSMGPQLITSDEISDISALSVQIVRNGTVTGENGAEASDPSPSDAAAWNEGDIILTYGGRAIELKAEGTVECRITGFPSLINKISAN